METTTEIIMGRKEPDEDRDEPNLGDLVNPQFTKQEIYETLFRIDRQITRENLLRRWRLLSLCVVCGEPSDTNETKVWNEILDGFDAAADPQAFVIGQLAKLYKNWAANARGRTIANLFKVMDDREPKE